MEYLMTKEQKLAQKLFKEFAEREVKPIAKQVDEEEYFPFETVKKMGQIGMMGIPFPNEVGGAGGDYLTYILAVEELAKVCATTAIILSAHTSLCCEPIYRFGNDFQKRKYLIPLVKGAKIGAFALTEPNAGTDAANQQTTAKLQGENYILNGTKIFVTNGGVADIYIVFATTNRELGTKDISAFIVEKDFEGFKIGKVEEKMGIRGSMTTEIVLENCMVPKENLLGAEGEGFKIALKTLDGGRIGVAAQALGIAEGAIDEVLKYVKERKQFNRPLSSFQGLQWYIAEMITNTRAAKLLVYDAALKKDKGLLKSADASMAKKFASDNAMFVTTQAVQIFGGYGYMKDYPIERMMRDAKITQIYEGTNEVQKMVIANQYLRR
ncbi:acyl-CoA dehydrogenase [Thermosipho melanesiensis]|uniref:Acyl-CoA dehydrogenase domain protein n=2 Tax=Thermosipho melanesiensis TaxID=46541 RepID=A6LKR9_THEM4|nr:acyl-CoA dehydrogenase [Thermosipho melanesiensis]ABR30520.1 acyl-CoA dehydrogenase domain protein [Thermosipho melanesiensis BI429]APT73671.1 acyl-CoA dehydrogenase [Thermosipho melanesiensis]OOC35611.1 acyl-CoA dehydrogenase [Thermosipho melanesiensis]OOC39285.1 acyl-CoA dehydrogenase [Thermosipho melanesiensis]OOC39371.1 acyl-CoA dehydrogenase [Thermosipho melanesiensis]